MRSFPHKEDALNGLGDFQMILQGKPPSVRVNGKLCGYFIEKKALREGTSDLAHCPLTFYDLYGIFILKDSQEHTTFSALMFKNRLTYLAFADHGKLLVARGDLSSVPVPMDPLS